MLIPYATVTKIGAGSGSYPVCTVTKIGAGSGLKIPPERLPFTPWVSRSMDFINFPPAKGESLTRANSRGDISRR